MAQKLGMMRCELLERMPEAEFQEWCRYFRIEAQSRELAGKAAAAKVR